MICDVLLRKMLLPVKMSYLIRCLVLVWCYCPYDLLALEILGDCFMMMLHTYWEGWHNKNDLWLPCPTDLHGDDTTWLKCPFSWRCYVMDWLEMYLVLMTYKCSYWSLLTMTLEICYMATDMMCPALWRFVMPKDYYIKDTWWWRMYWLSLMDDIQRLPDEMLQWDVCTCPLKCTW